MSTGRMPALIDVMGHVQRMVSSHLEKSISMMKISLAWIWCAMHRNPEEQALPCLSVSSNVLRSFARAADITQGTDAVGAEKPKKRFELSYDALTHGAQGELGFRAYNKNCFES